MTIKYPSSYNKIYKTVTIPTMTYRAACWKMNMKDDEMLMNENEMRMLR